MTSNNCYGRGHEVPDLPSLRRWPSGDDTKSHKTVNDEALSDEDSASISMRLFGRVLQIGNQVCKGPCVGNDKLAFAFESDKD